MRRPHFHVKGDPNVPSKKKPSLLQSWLPLPAEELAPLPTDKKAELEQILADLLVAAAVATDNERSSS
jgi:hypothetical protein